MADDVKRPTDRKKETVAAPKVEKFELMRYIMTLDMKEPVYVMFKEDGETPTREAGHAKTEFSDDKIKSELFSATNLFSDGGCDMGSAVRPSTILSEAARSILSSSMLLSLFNEG